MKEKCIVLFSGGLDSRLAVKLIEERGFEPLLIFFRLPFGTGCCNEGCCFNFSQVEGLKLEIFDCRIGKLLQEYLDVIREAKHGRGSGFNPCIDCRIFMFKKAKEFADEKGINFIATGEVVGQRPMSQQKKQIELIEKESGLEGRIIRPLIEIGIKGRQRKKQIELAKKFKIKYPHPAGGCLLCEKALKKRFEFLLKRGINQEELKLVNIGRHFLIDGCWVVVGRDERENKIIECFQGHIKPDYPGPSAIVLFNSPTSPKIACSLKTRKIDKEQLMKNSMINSFKKSPGALARDKSILKVNELIKAYSKKGSVEKRKEFERYKF